MALQRVEAGLRLRVPHLHHEVVGTADHPPAVVLDAAHGRHVAHEHVETLTRLDVPDAQRGVTRAADHPEGRPETQPVRYTVRVSRKRSNCREVSMLSFTFTHEEHILYD